MKLTPLDVQHQKFKVRFRGFDVKAVDAFLEQVTDTLESNQLEMEKLKQDVHRLEKEILGYKEREESIKHAMFNSQKVSEQMRENAQKSADLIMAEAEVKAEKILNKAHNRLAQLHEDITELKRQRIQIEVQISSIIEAHTKLLEMSKESMNGIDDEESKLQLLSPSKP